MSSWLTSIEQHLEFSREVIGTWQEMISAANLCPILHWLKKSLVPSGSCITLIFHVQKWKLFLRVVLEHILIKNVPTIYEVICAGLLATFLVLLFLSYFLL